MMKLPVAALLANLNPTVGLQPGQQFMNFDRHVPPTILPRVPPTRAADAAVVTLSLELMLGQEDLSPWFSDLPMPALNPQRNLIALDNLTSLRNELLRNEHAPVPKNSPNRGLIRSPAGDQRLPDAPLAGTSQRMSQ